ncbi:hypothetical protein XA68_16265 [Ophiocordyceps unilateralis]|uniref:Uncharacterized protein n=1 Tax=Ophiocordyceps unilateralis TaxID=268505 RepID=A0A2A9P540_OPHUN|nr:hypothetical protein XA68_16265 [Ophiocordyceps unilateralis]
MRINQQDLSLSLSVWAPEAQQQQPALPPPPQGTRENDSDGVSESEKSMGEMRPSIFILASLLGVYAAPESYSHHPKGTTSQPSTHSVGPPKPGAPPNQVSPGKPGASQRSTAS